MKKIKAATDHKYPFEKENVGAEPDVSVGIVIPASLVAAMTDSGGLSAGKDNTLISIVITCTIKTSISK